MKSARTLLVFLISSILLIAGAAGVYGQTPAGGSQTQKVVERTVTTDAQGNTIVTERTFVGGNLVKEEITVTSPQGAVIGKMEVSYDPATGQVIKREIKVQTDSIPPSIREALSSIGIPVPQGVSVKIEEERRNGQTISVEVSFVQNGVKVEQEYKLVNGQLTLVKEERENEKEHQAGGDDHKEETKDSKSASGGQTGTSGAGTEQHGTKSEKKEDHDKNNEQEQEHD